MSLPTQTINKHQQLNYYSIAKAIEYIKSNLGKQLTFDEVAEQVHLDTF